MRFSLPSFCFFQRFAAPISIFLCGCSAVPIVEVAIAATAPRVFVHRNSSMFKKKHEKVQQGFISH